MGTGAPWLAAGWVAADGSIPASTPASTRKPTRGPTPGPGPLGELYGPEVRRRIFSWEQSGGEVQAFIDRVGALLDDPDGGRVAVVGGHEVPVAALAAAFPTRQMQVFTDADGNIRSEPMSDEDGQPVQSREALSARDDLIEQLCALPPIGTALDTLIERFGSDSVAEVTGRSRRLVVGPDGCQKLETRGFRSNLRDADAFMRGLAGSTDPTALREAVTALRQYADGFTRAYGTETPISAKITGPRETLEKQLADAEAAQLSPGPIEPGDDSKPVGPSEPTDPAPRGKPWKGLVIGGGVAIAVGVGATVLAGVGGARGRGFEAKFDDPANMCVLSNQTPKCAELYDAGKASNTMTIAGAIAAPLLVGAGVALLVIGLKRRNAGREASTALVPTLAPGFAGFSLSGRF